MTLMVTVKRLFLFKSWLIISFLDTFKNNHLTDTILSNGKANKLDKSVYGSNVEVITLLGNEMASKEGSSVLLACGSIVFLSF